MEINCKNPKSPTHYYHIGFYTLIGIPFTFFLWVMKESVLNLPFYDDYDATLLFLKQYYFENAGQNMHFLTILFQQHNEHRILLSRLLTLAYYNLTHEINFAHLVYIQNSLLVVVFLFMVRRARTTLPNNLWILVIISLSLFNLSSWHTAFLYSSGIQHYASFLFAFLSLFYLNKCENYKNMSFILAAFFGFMATYSFGNGLLVMPTGLLMLWLSNKKGLLIGWAALFGIYALFYIYNLQMSPPEGSAFQLRSFAIFLFTYLGSFSFVYPQVLFLAQINVVLSILLGLGILVMWVYLYFSGYARRNPLLFSLLSFCIISAILLAISRSGFKVAGAITHRYSFFAKCIFVWALMASSEAFQISGKTYRWLTGIGTMMWLLTTFHLYPHIKSDQISKLKEMKDWKQGTAPFLMPELPVDRFGEILHWAEKEKIYQSPSVDELDVMMRRMGATDQIP